MFGRNILPGVMITRWLLGLAPIGRATVLALHLNREGVVNFRRALMALQVHPSNDG